MTPALPSYTKQDVKQALAAVGASGTIYSLVMPESEAGLADLIGDARRDALFDMYREPWTQKQDATHDAYFAIWLEWSAPVVSMDAGAFPFRYPTAGASEGIFKLLAEYQAGCRSRGATPLVHIFEGEYEGFPAYADALGVEVRRHDRSRWREAVAAMEERGQFWISQPSAIDGMVWPDFQDFLAAMAETRPDVAVIPDLTYVGSVARDFSVDLRAPNIPAVVISQSKPFGGYYHRVGGVLSRTELASLFGNKWFKNLLSLAWATEMMRRHGVHDLPRKYRPQQEQACRLVGALLGYDELRPADVILLGAGQPDPAMPALLQNVLRGSPGEQAIRLCLTPTMTALIDPAMAPRTSPALAARWDRVQ